MKMRLQNTEFLSEYGGRLPAGSVIDVPEPVAERWLMQGIARKASASAKTFAEERLERMDLEREEAALNEGPVYDAMVTREGTSGAEADLDGDVVPEAAESDDDKPARRKR